MRVPGDAAGTGGVGHAVASVAVAARRRPSSRSSGVFRASVVVPFSSRLASPVSAPAGGSSTRRVHAALGHRGHADVPADRAGDLRRPAGRAPRRRSVTTCAVRVGQQRAARVGDRDARRPARAVRRWAGCHVLGVERARDLQLDDLRRPSRASRRRLVDARRAAPAATIWPAPLRLAGTRSSSASHVDDLVGLAAEHGGHAGRRERARGGHLPAAHGGERDRVVGAEHAGDRGRGQLTDGVPGDDQVGRQLDPAAQLLEREQRERDDQRLGDRRCP